MTQATERLTDWEYTTCSRCGGSGSYSYCQRYGTVCFKCGGKKRVLTKRGQAALLWLREQRTVPASQVKVGDRYRFEDFFASKVRTETIVEIRTDNPNGGLILRTKSMGHGVGPNTPIEVIPATEEERVAQVRAAIEYQNQLTKAGKPRKVKA